MFVSHRRGGRGERAGAALPGGWGPGDLLEQDGGTRAPPLLSPSGFVSTRHGSETWVLTAGLTFLGIHSLSLGNSILKLPEECEMVSGACFWSRQGDTLSLRLVSYWLSV